MVTISPRARHELAEHARESSAVAGIVHGLVFVVPVWTIVASVAVLAVAR